jgi:O-phospho-L-seryl-tRNASec:L-selenocysteinyl-tRNA synthase
VFHLINNAYGLQSASIADKILQANAVGTVDVVISSLDKNFMVPVGGSIAYCFNDNKFIQSLTEAYPGRASSYAIVDFVITMLEMGSDHLSQILQQRKDVYEYMSIEVAKIAEAVGGRKLMTPKNKISMCFTIEGIKRKDPESLGKMLFYRKISGIRIVNKGTFTIGGTTFNNFGSHTSEYPYLPYINVAAAIGISLDEAKEALNKIKQLLESEITKEPSK